MQDGRSLIPEVLRERERELLADWVAAQLGADTYRPDVVQEAQIRQQSAEFISLLRNAVATGDLTVRDTPAWSAVHDLLTSVSRARAAQGATPSETATFVFSFKQPLFSQLRDAVPDNPAALADEVWRATTLLDRLGLFTTEAYLRSREEVILRQQQEMLELSTPVVRLWDGVLALPLIGTLDSARTQVVMEALLQGIVQEGAEMAIIDITGVPMVDTLVAQHLLRTVAAARLMGAECIISGIRPQIAQTIVHLGVDLSAVITKASLSDALLVALARAGLTVSRADGRVS